MKTASDLVIDIGYLKAVIDAADFIDNEDACSVDLHRRNMITSLIHVAGHLAAAMQDDIEELAESSRRYPK